MDKDFLADLPVEKSFWFHNGIAVRNVYELVREINHGSDGLFFYHCNEDHDDFANWIGGVIEDIWLSEKLRKIKDKKTYVFTINNRIRFLEKQKSTNQQSKILSEKVRSLIKDYSHIWLFIIVIIATSIITSIIYFEYHTLMNVKSLDEKINYMEDRTTCYNSYFNDQILKTRSLVNSSLFNLDQQCVFNYTPSPKIPSEIYESNPEVIPISSIKSGPNTAIININDSRLVIFANSSSMVPTFGHNTKALEIVPKSDKELHIGDIISYKSGQDIIVHRIIDIGKDSEGWYAVAKGDNNEAVDLDKVRFDNIQGKIVVLIY